MVQTIHKKGCSFHNEQPQKKIYIKNMADNIVIYIIIILF